MVLKHKIITYFSLIINKSKVNLIVGWSLKIFKIPLGNMILKRTPNLHYVWMFAHSNRMVFKNFILLSLCQIHLPLWLHLIPGDHYFNILKLTLSEEACTIVIFCPTVVFFSQQIFNISKSSLPPSSVWKKDLAL